VASDKRTFFSRYWWVFAGVLSAAALSTALNISNADGWVMVTRSANDTFVIDWNTTRPATCSSGNYTYWNGSTFLCREDASGGGNSSADGNNYTTGIAFTGTSTKTLTMNRLGMVDLTASFIDLFQNFTTEINSLNSTKLNITDQRYNETASINSLSTFAQTKAATGTISSSTLCLQNVTSTNATLTGAYTSCGGGGGSGTVTSVATGNGLTGGTITTTGNLSVNSPTCGAGEFLRWSGSAFTCSTPSGGSAGRNVTVVYSSVQYATTNAVTYTVMSNLTTSLSSSSTYLIACTFLTFSAAVATGEQLQVNLSGTPTSATFSFNSQVSATTRTSLQGVSTSTNAFADTGSAGTNVRDTARLSGYVVTGANPVTLTYAMKSEVAASNAAYDSGSACTYTEVV